VRRGAGSGGSLRRSSGERVGQCKSGAPPIPRNGVSPAIAFPKPHIGNEGNEGNSPVHVPAAWSGSGHGDASSNVKIDPTLGREACRGCGARVSEGGPVSKAVEDYCTPGTGVRHELRAWRVGSGAKERRGASPPSDLETRLEGVERWDDVAGVGRLRVCGRCSPRLFWETELSPWNA
jgi:hypothetical protein